MHDLFFEYANFMFEIVFLGDIYVNLLVLMVKFHFLSWIPFSNGDSIFTVVI